MEKKNNGFENLHEWSERMQGAREMLIKLYDDDDMTISVSGKHSEDKVYTRAMVELLRSDLRNVENYLLGTQIGFRKHVRNQKGKLVSCEAYFIE